MAAPLQLNNLPDTIRAQYNRAGHDIDVIQMAKEVPRQYQRNSEDAQLLKFPSTKTILWDHAAIGSPHTLHISYYRKPKLSISEKVLRFAQRHVESTDQKSCGCVLVGTVNIDDDGEGVVFAVERLDPAGNPNSSSSHAAGDMLIPFTIQKGSKDRSSTVEDYSSAFQLLKQRCHSKDPIDLGNFLLTKGWCSFYPNGDKCVHHLDFEVVTMATEIKATPIAAVPIVPTALSKNLSGPMSISHMQGTPKTGYLTMDHTRKLLLVLESDPKVVNLPLVGIWVSGVAYAYSPYVWAACLRYLHNSSIQDRVCNPPDPFLLVLYNPSHSKPEFYECFTSSGTNKMSFDYYTGYEALQLNKGEMNSSSPLEVDIEQVSSGPKYEMFEAALEQFSPQLEADNKRSMSPEPSGNEDITPRLQPAPYMSKMQLTQSMVPEVSLFFGNEDTTFVPTVQHPKGGVQAMKSNVQPESRAQYPQYVPSSLPQNSSQGAVNKPTSLPSSINSAQNMGKPIQNGQNVQNNNSNPQFRMTNTGMPMNNQNSHSQQQSQSQTYQRQTSHQEPTLATQYTSHPMSKSHPPPHTSTPMYPPYPAGVHGARPGFCSCPSCPKPPTYSNPYNGPAQMFEAPTRGQMPPARQTYPNYGPPPPRLSGNGSQHMPHPQMHTGYPTQPGQVQPGYNQPFPQSSEYPGQRQIPPYPTSQHSSSMAQNSNPDLQYNYQQNQQNLPNNFHGKSNQPFAPNSNPPSSNPNTNIARPAASHPVKQLSSVPAPQASGGLPVRSEERTLSPRTPVHSAEYPGPRQGEQVAAARGSDVRRSNPNSDNSGRSSDDSGLSFTPEKHNSPSNNNNNSNDPKPTQVASNPIATVTDTPTPSLPASVNWDNVPPQIYQLLLEQDKQLKQLQAQISFLTTQQTLSMNNTAESQTAQVTQLTNNTNIQSGSDKCHIATNTSAGLAYTAGSERKEQVSACMQTSPEKMKNLLQNSQQSISNNSQQTLNKALSESRSSSNGSGCETRTPLEIRHRGKLPMNSTQREDVELDMSQGELVALMNNMHDKTIDSVQSDMIVDLPSFQSSPSRSPRSQESYSDSTAFNLSPRSPISASMCEREVSEYDSDYTDDEGDNRDAENTAGTDNPEYYVKLMDNIKKLLSQNTTDDIEHDDERDGYQGDVSSDPSTPIKLAKQDIKLGAQLQSFFKMDDNPRSTTDTTFIPRINYVSMLLDSDCDTSMEINAMAMKYLKDEQLTQLTKLQAKNRLLKGSKQSSLEKTALLQKILKAEDESTPNVTQFGMSPNDMTFATKNYMEKHGLLNGTVGSKGSTSDSTYNDSYKLKTNYSTMSCSSDDGPAQVTQEVLSTPTYRRTLPSEPVTASGGRMSDGAYSNGTTPTQDTTGSRTPYNDSRQSAGFNGTPKPGHTKSRLSDEHRRLSDEHRRFNPRSDSHNSSVPQSHNSTPYSNEVSPYTQNGSVPRSRNNNVNGANGRYASPQITPAPSRPKHSPPEKEMNNQQRRYQNELRQENEGFPRNGGLLEKRNVNVQEKKGHIENQGVQNYYNARQYKEETNEEDRILDITRLKQLPKLL